ncbi:MAG: dihydropteroate synthase, partial [Candidatus Susulua stagnicola]|nr:dihydropteroate synthase [Candidatus Susulua stagnicola]
GSDAALERKALLKNIKTSVLIFGNLSQLKKLSEKLKDQPFALKEVSLKISEYLKNLEKGEFILKARGKMLRINQPIICGIINSTEDSFFGDGLLKVVENSSVKVQALALKKAEKMIKAGAKIIDVGGESTRPFSNPVKVGEEIKRVIPILKVLRKEFKQVFLSVDTYKYLVAKAAVSEGVDIINDITALQDNPQMASLVKKHKLGCVLMHMKGKPQNMQAKPYYKDVITEISDFFQERLNFCDKKGINKNQLFLDPGIGFGKRLEDNTKIINQLYKLKVFGLPIFLGLSHKSFIGKILNIDIKQRLVGTIAASIISLTKGANVLRVHDVGETAQAIKVASKIMNN